MIKLMPDKRSCIIKSSLFSSKTDLPACLLPPAMATIDVYSNFASVQSVCSDILDEEKTISQVGCIEFIQQMMWALKEVLLSQK